MESGLLILTEQQKTAYHMRLQGLSFLKIAQRMGVSASVVRRHFLAAQRRLREYEAYHREQAQNDLPVELPLTRGELDIVLTALGLLERKLIAKAGGANVQRDFCGSLPYQAQIVAALYERAQIALYGAVSFSSHLVPQKEESQP